MSAEKHNPSIPANVSLKLRTLKIIDKYRVGHGYKNRSDYIQNLVNCDLDYSRFEFITELMSMNVLPLMGFLMFCFLAVLTKGSLFYLFAGIFGIFAVWLSIMYVKKHGKRRKSKIRG